LKRSSQKTDHMPPIRHIRRRNRKNLDQFLTEKVEFGGWFEIVSMHKFCKTLSTMSFMIYLQITDLAVFIIVLVK